MMGAIFESFVKAQLLLTSPVGRGRRTAPGEGARAGRWHCILSPQPAPLAKLHGERQALIFGRRSSSVRAYSNGAIA
jgi:hypothetical protein